MQIEKENAIINKSAGILIREATATKPLSDDVAVNLSNVVVWNPADDLGTKDPLILGQKFTNLSFIFFDKPQTIRGAPIFGFVKFRGSHETDKAAIDAGHQIISDVETKYKILVAPTGVWVPLTESNFVVKEEYDVRGQEDELHLRDKAVKEKEASDKRKIMELKEEEKKFKETKDMYETEDTLDFYTLKRVTEYKIDEARAVAIRELKKLDDKLLEVRNTCLALEKNHPNYYDEWIDNYNKPRSAVGIPEFVLEQGETAYDIYARSISNDNSTLTI